MGKARLTGLVLMLATLAACAPNTPPPPEPAAPAPTQPAGDDTCGRAEWARYIGRPRSELPAVSDPRRVRIACSTCAVTMDYRADRVTVIYDTETERVTAARCG